MSSTASFVWRRIHRSSTSNRLLCTAAASRRRTFSCGQQRRLVAALPRNRHTLPQKRLYHGSSLRLEKEEAKGESGKGDKKAAMDTKKTTSLKETVAAQNKESSSDDSSKKGKVDSSSSSSDEDEKPKTTSAATKDEKTKATSGATTTSAAATAPSSNEATATETPSTTKEYSYPELTEDAAKHKAGLDDPTRPDWQNPLHHNNPDMQKCYPEDFDTPEEFEAAVLPAPPIDPGDGRVVAPPHMHELVDEVVHLTMLEYNELINKIADHYGFHESDLAPDDDGDDGGGDEDDSGDGAPAEAKTAFDVKLVSFDAKAKIKIIKEVRTIVAGLGLKEAKAMVEGAPIVLQKGINKDDAEQVKAKLEELGAVIEVD